MHALRSSACHRIARLRSRCWSAAPGPFAMHAPKPRAAEPPHALHVPVSRATSAAERSVAARAAGAGLAVSNVALTPPTPPPPPPPLQVNPGLAPTGCTGQLDDRTAPRGHQADGAYQAQVGAAGCTSPGQLCAGCACHHATACVRERGAFLPRPRERLGALTPAVQRRLRASSTGHLGSRGGRSSHSPLGAECCCPHPPTHNPLRPPHLAPVLSPTLCRCRHA